METGINKTWDKAQGFSECIFKMWMLGLPSILETSLKFNSDTEDEIPTETGTNFLFL